MIVDSGYWEKKVGKGVSINEEAEKFIRINNLAWKENRKTW